MSNSGSGIWETAISMGLDLDNGWTLLYFNAYEDF